MKHTVEERKNMLIEAGDIHKKVQQYVKDTLISMHENDENQPINLYSLSTIIENKINTKNVQSLIL